MIFLLNRVGWHDWPDARMDKTGWNLTFHGGSHLLVEVLAWLAGDRN